MRWIISCVLLFSVVQSAAAQERGFSLDIEGRKLRDIVESWTVADLAVGDAGYVWIGFCRENGALFLRAEAGLREVSEYSANIRVKMLPSRRVTVTVLPSPKNKEIKPADLKAFAFLYDCAVSRQRGEMEFMPVDAVNGESTLSGLLDKLLGSAAAPEKEQPAEAKTSRRTIGAWMVSLDKSKIDDSPGVFMLTEAVEEIWAEYRRVLPSLVIRCAENTTSLYVIFETYMGGDKIKAEIRLDNDPARTVAMNPSNTKKAIGLWNGRVSIPFIKRMFDKKKIVVRVQPRGGKTMTAEFDIKGLREAIEPLSEACHWK